MFKKGDFAKYRDQQIKIIRGAPVRYGFKRVVVEQVSNHRRFTVELRHLTPFAPDAAQCPGCGEILNQNGDCPEGCFPSAQRR
jgi:hypothetical protein